MFVLSPRDAISLPRASDELFLIACCPFFPFFDHPPPPVEIDAERSPNNAECISEPSAAAEDDDDDEEEDPPLVPASRSFRSDILYDINLNQRAKI